MRHLEKRWKETQTKQIRQSNFENRIAEFSSTLGSAAKLWAFWAALASICCLFEASRKTGNDWQRLAVKVEQRLAVKVEAGSIVVCTDFQQSPFSWGLVQLCGKKALRARLRPPLL